MQVTRRQGAGNEATKKLNLPEKRQAFAESPTAQDALHQVVRALVKYHLVSLSAESNGSDWVSAG